MPIARAMTDATITDVMVCMVSVPQVHRLDEQQPGAEHQGQHDPAGRHQREDGEQDHHRHRRQAEHVVDDPEAGVQGLLDGVEEGRGRVVGEVVVTSSPMSPMRRSSMGHLPDMSRAHGEIVHRGAHDAGDRRALLVEDGHRHDLAPARCMKSPITAPSSTWW